MKKLLGTLLALVLLAGCSAGPVEETAAALGLDLSAGTPVVQEETHGGFHGDGETYLELTFGDDGLEEALERAGDWKALPLTGPLGKTLAANQRSSVLTQPETGWWFFRDSHSQSRDSADAGALNDRASFNFDAAVYDSATRTLYYYALDT